MRSGLDESLVTIFVVLLPLTPASRWLLIRLTMAISIAHLVMIAKFSVIAIDAAIGRCWEITVSRFVGHKFPSHRLIFHLMVVTVSMHWFSFTGHQIWVVELIGPPWSLAVDANYEIDCDLENDQPNAIHDFAFFYYFSGTFGRFGHFFSLFFDGIAVVVNHFTREYPRHRHILFQLICCFNTIHESFSLESRIISPTLNHLLAFAFIFEQNKNPL